MPLGAHAEGPTARWGAIPAARRMVVRRLPCDPACCDGAARRSTAYPIHANQKAVTGLKLAVRDNRAAAVAGEARPRLDPHERHGVRLR